MNDQELDRALSEALDVDHSPEFVARLRTALSASATPHWRWLTVVAGTVTAGAVLVAALTMTRPRSEPRELVSSVPGEGRSTVPAGELSAPPVGEGGPASRPASAASARTTSTMDDEAVRPPFSEVVISPDDARGLATLAALGRAGALSGIWPASVPNGGDPTLSVIELSSITIEPMPDIEPLKWGGDL